MPQRTQVHRPFVIAALVATLTLGASFGAYNLLAIHLALGPVHPAHNWVHAGFQVWGFVFMFIMGISYHLVPGFLHTELQNPALARATLWLGVAGLFGFTWGRFGSLLPATDPALLMGSILLFGAVAGWAVCLGATLRAARAVPEPMTRYLVAGTVWWIVAAGFLVAGGVSGGDTAGWNEAIYTAALFGGALSWIQGVFLRIGRPMLALAATHERWVQPAFGLGLAGAILATAGAASIGQYDLADAVYDAGVLLVAAGLALFTAAVRPFSTRKVLVAGAGEPHFVRIVRMAFLGGGLFIVLGAGYAAADLLQISPSRLIHDGARHAFTLGFLTLMIVGFAGRMLPIFAGVDLRWPKLRFLGAHLIAFAVLMREAQVAATLSPWPDLLVVSGVSGPIAAIGVALAAISLLGTLRVELPMQTSSAAHEALRQTNADLGRAAARDRGDLRRDQGRPDSGHDRCG